jgi:hypothetical protein
MDSVSKNLEKVGKSLYDLFDNSYIKILVITILVIYSSGLFIDFNLQLSSVFNNTIMRLIILIIVVAISQKNVTIAMLLVLALALSSYYRKDAIERMANESDDSSSDDDKDVAVEKTSNKKGKGGKGGKK